MSPGIISAAKYAKTALDSIYVATIFVIDVAVMLLSCAAATLEALYRLIIKPAKKSLAGDVVLITGGGGGLGREMALEFTRRGVQQVVLLDIDQEACLETAALVAKEGKKAHAYYCDVADQQAIQTIVRQITEEVGPITILVNNAGIMTAQAFIHQTPEKIKRQMDVNTMSHFWLLHEFLPKMMNAGKGHIVAVSSIAGRFPAQYLLPYVASKFAVTGIMECLQEELRKTGSWRDIKLTTAFPSTLGSSLCKRPKLDGKYPFHCLIPCDVAARRIIDGVQRNLEHVYIPAKFEFLYRFSHLNPRRVQKIFFDFLEIGVYPDDD